MIRNLDLNLVAVLDALYQERSVTGAARRLKVSQPTVSSALSRLRHYFRDDLFVRERGKMRPTQFALTLQAPVQQILTIVQRDVLPSMHFCPNETMREFTLCTSDIGELCFLPLLIEAFEARAPYASLRCLSLPTGQVKTAIIANTVDVAVGYFPDLGSDEIRSQHLFDHPFVCIARRGHPNFAAPLDLESFLRSKHAVVHHEGRSQEIAEQAMEKLALDRRVFLKSPHFVSLPFLLASTDMMSIVPRSLATSFGNVVGLQVAKPPFDIPDIPLRQHWAERASTDPAVAWLVALIEELFLGADPTLHQ
jgi:DNA-binding transcriptional LysR family regulator